MHRFLKLMSYVFAETRDKFRTMIGYIHEKGYLLSFCFRSATTGDACQSKNKTKQLGLFTGTTERPHTDWGDSVKQEQYDWNHGYRHQQPLSISREQPHRSKIAALQKAGSKLVDGAQVANSDTKDANLDTKEASSDTRKSNFDTNIATTLTPKQQKVLEYCVEPRNSREILEHIGVSTHSKNTKKYVTDLVKLGVLKMTNPATIHAPNQRYYSQSSGGEPTSKE